MVRVLLFFVMDTVERKLERFWNLFTFTSLGHSLGTYIPTHIDLFKTFWICILSQRTSFGVASLLPVVVIVAAGAVKCPLSGASVRPFWKQLAGRACSQYPTWKVFFCPHLGDLGVEFSIRFELGQKNRLLTVGILDCGIPMTRLDPANYYPYPCCYCKKMFKNLKSTYFRGCFLFCPFLHL